MGYVVGGLGTSLGHGEVWIGVPVWCYTECNTNLQNNLASAASAVAVAATQSLPIPTPSSTSIRPVVLEPLRRLWCKVTLQSRLVLELQTIDSQACIGKNRGSRLSKSEGSGHLLVQVFCQKKGMH